MNILVKAKDLYDECGLDLYRDIAAYAAHGYVFITPSSFLLGKSVDTTSDIKPQDQWDVEKPNAWYVHMAVGEFSTGVKEFISRIPYPLPFVGWSRATKNQPVRWYDFKKIIRRK